MKNIIWKYFTNTQKYIDVLPSMVEKYNNTYHRSIMLTPSDARNPAIITYTVHSMLMSLLEKLYHLNSMLVIKYLYKDGYV